MTLPGIVHLIRRCGRQNCTHVVALCALPVCLIPVRRVPSPACKRGNQTLDLDVLRVSTYC
eukprot:5485256-Pleurochrysis_carterae.AAC.1